MANSITRCISVITLSLVCFSSFAWANTISYGLYAEHDKPVYLAALISNKPITSSAINKSQLQQSQMQFLFQRDYSIRQLVRHIGSWSLIGNKANPQYANALDADSLAAIYRLNQQLFTANNKSSLGLGDILVIQHSNAQTNISLNGTLISTVNDPGFYFYLANMWLGESAASKSFQQQLFKPNPKLAALYQQQSQGKAFAAAPAPTPASQTTPKKAAVPAAISPKEKTEKVADTAKPKVADIPNPKAAATKTSATAQAAKRKPKPEVKTKASKKPVVANTKTSNTQPKKISKPSYTPMQQSFEQAQKSNYLRLVQAIDNASFPIEKQAINAVILFVDQNGQVISANVVSETVKDTELLSKKMAFISQDISPIVTTDAMQQPGVYAFKINFKP